MAVPSPNTTAAGPHHHDPPPPLLEAKTLTEGLVLLAEFASLDSSAYQASFAYPAWPRGRLDSSDNDDDESTSEQGRPMTNSSPANQQPHDKHRRSLLRLEQLQAQQNMQNTPLPELWRALHRLHANVAILQDNEARHAAEIKAMRDEMAGVHKTNQRLNKAVKVLNKQNTTLKAKLQEKRSLLKQARSFFLNSQEMQRDLEQENKAIKLQAHEQFLLASRERLGSTDSNFSDADALFFAPSQAGDSTLGQSSDTEQSDTLSLQSMHSNGSLITDDGVSTMKIGSSTPENLVVSTTANTNLVNASPMSHVSVASDLTVSTSCHVPGGPLNHPASPCRPGIYKLCFPYGQEHGLTIVVIPLKDLPHPPKGKLTNEVLHEENSDSEEAPRTSSTSFRLPNLLGKPPREEQIKGNAFIVAACDGDHIEPKPTVGARIVSIGRQPVDAKWKLNQLLDRLNEVAGLSQEKQESAAEDTQDDAEQDGDEPEQIVAYIDDHDSVESHTEDDKKKTERTFPIYFRNDALTKKQKDMLSKKDDTVASPDQPREHRAFGLGFLKIGKSEKKMDDAVAEVSEAEEKDSSHAESSKDEGAATESAAESPPKTGRGKSKNPLFFWGRDSETSQKDAENADKADQDEKEGGPDVDETLPLDGSGDSTDQVGTEPAKDDEPEQKEALETEAKEEEGGKKADAAPPLVETKSDDKDDSPAGGQSSRGRGKNPLFFWDRGEKNATEESKEPSKEEGAAAASKTKEQGADSKSNEAKPEELPKSPPPKPDSDASSKKTTPRRYDLSTPFWRTSPRSNKPSVSVDEEDKEKVDTPEP